MAENDHAKLKGLLWIGLTLVFAFLLIRSVPFLAKRVPWSYEKKIAEYIKNAEAFPECHSVSGDAALTKIVKRLYPFLPEDSFPLQVNVISGKTINAFASLNGEIYVYDGLLRKATSPEELAGVLAHEMEHVHHRHIIQGVFWRVITAAVFGGLDPQMLSLLINLKFSREQESEADQDGLLRLNRAQINAQGFLDFFNREAAEPSMPAFLTDHPSATNRAELAAAYLHSKSSPLLSSEEWQALRSICGKSE